MAAPDLLTTSSPFLTPLRPRDEELDLFGLTHIGKVRKLNQDHFMLCTVHPQVHMHGTSLPHPDELPMRGERLATIMLVADGVGGTTGGGDASQLVVETITKYVASSLRCYHAAGTSKDREFEDALRAAALEAHSAVKAEAAARPEPQRMATTMTLAIIIWPWVYVVQVGDSRCYVYLNGNLKQVTRDQTMAQALVDEGAMPKESLHTSPLSHVLVSSIGGDAAAPEVSKLDIKNRDSVLLLCSDGLTKHVSDEEIGAAIGAMQSSEQLCRTLLDLVLERGGSDNVTILAGRAPRHPRLSGS
ncbi:MAG: protein phosphatase 2C domain-containing protein [Gemmatimonadales bacterium]